MSRLLKLAVPIFSVCFSLSVSAARPQLPPAWDGSSVRFDSRTYGYMPPVRIVAQEQADLISGGDLLLEAGNGQADRMPASACSAAVTAAVRGCCSTSAASCRAGCVS